MRGAVFGPDAGGVGDDDVGPDRTPQIDAAKNQQHQQR